MQTLQISPQKAKELFPTASAEFKAMLTDTFGETFFSQKITDRIKTFEDACAETGENITQAKFYVGSPDDIAYQKLKVIVRALNPKGWVPDWNNSNQRKWAPWFYMNDNPGFRFYASDYATTVTLSTGGSRLCFASEELSDYAAKQFLDLYKAWLA